MLGFILIVITGNFPLLSLNLARDCSRIGIVIDFVFLGHPELVVVDLTGLFWSYLIVIDLSMRK